MVLVYGIDLVVLELFEHIRTTVTDGGTTGTVLVATNKEEARESICKRKMIRFMIIN